jgi:hypothetical protein
MAQPLLGSNEKIPELIPAVKMEHGSTAFVRGYGDMDREYRDRDKRISRIPTFP